MARCIASFRLWRAWYGASICEIPIKNVNRERGKSHYGIGRTFGVFFDLLTIRFLLQVHGPSATFFWRLRRAGDHCGLYAWLDDLAGAEADASAP
jgi:hypothetical protein